MASALETSSWVDEGDDGFLHQERMKEDFVLRPRRRLDLRPAGWRFSAGEVGWQVGTAASSPPDTRRTDQV